MSPLHQSVEEKQHRDDNGQVQHQDEPE